MLRSTCCCATWCTCMASWSPRMQPHPLSEDQPLSCVVLSCHRVSNAVLHESVCCCAERSGWGYLCATGCHLLLAGRQCRGTSRWQGLSCRSYHRLVSFV